jgi:hypothetical protein
MIAMVHISLEQKLQVLQDRVRQQPVSDETRTGGRISTCEYNSLLPQLS